MSRLSGLLSAVFAKIEANESMSARDIARLLEALSGDLDARQIKRCGKESELTACLSQHPVGQGLFHSGFVEFPGTSPFRYVYDCGKYLARRSEWHDIIGPVAEEYGRRPLEALFISHLDSDHVNGLGELLHAFGGADTAFLPYLDPPSRLLQAALEQTSSTAVDAARLAFLADPLRWLLARGVRHVVVVQPQSAKPDGESHRVVQLATGSDESSRYVLEIGVSTTELNAILAPGDMSDIRPFADRVLAMECRVPVIVRVPTSKLAWIFQTYVDPNIEGRSRLNVLLREALGPKTFVALASGRVACAELLADARLLRRVATVYRSALRDRHRLGRAPTRVRLERGPQTAGVDRSPLNRGSMSLFSGPLMSGSKVRSQAVERANRFSSAGTPDVSMQGERQGWLLTGDSVLRERDALNQFSTFFGGRPSGTDCLSQTLVFTTPHHGSAANFDASALLALRVPPIAVIPAGNGRFFGHPAEAVVKMLTSKGVHVEHIHDEQMQAFKHELQVIVWRLAAVVG